MNILSKILKSKIKERKSGFSLLEVVITIFIVGVVLVLYQASLNNFQLIRTSKNQGIALRVANNKLESLRAGGYDNLPSSGSFSDSQLTPLLDSSAEMTITDFNDNTKEVLITIQWREKTGAPLKSVTLTTLVTEVGGL